MFDITRGPCEQLAGPAVTPSAFIREAALLERWQAPSSQNEKKEHPEILAHRAWHAAASDSTERSAPSMSSIGVYWASLSKQSASGFGMVGVDGMDRINSMGDYYHTCCDWGRRFLS